MSTLTVIDRRVKYRNSCFPQRGPIGVGYQQRRDEAALRISRAAMLNLIEPRRPASVIAPATLEWSA